MSASSVPFPQLDQPSSASFSRQVLESDAAALRSALAALARAAEAQLFGASFSYRLAEERAKILVASPGSLSAGLLAKVKQALDMAPTTFLNLNRKHLLLPRELRTEARITHDLLHQLTLCHHYNLKQEQSQIDSFLRHNGEYKSFDLLCFYNAVSQHVKQKQRFMIQPEYITPINKQLEFLMDLHNRKPKVREHLIQLVKFPRASISRSMQGLAPSTRAPCALILRST